MFELHDRVAIVTGAGSPHGIGRATALALARQGAAVVICDLNTEGVNRVVEELKRAGGRAMGVTADVTSADEITAAVAEVVRAWGQIDILVNNAGITQPVKVIDTSVEDWNRVLAVNLTGTFICSKAVLPFMIRQKYGRIINMSSVSAKRGGGVFGGAHYSAAKAGILGFSKALAREVASEGITVNSVTPGIALTDIRGGIENEEMQKKLSEGIPCGRMAMPEEIAATICFLASEEAAYITGEEIDINGGSHMD